MSHFLSNWQPDRGNQAEFRSWAASFMSETILTKLGTKGEEYSPDASPSALENFNAVSAMMEISPAAYLMAVATKHWHVLCRWSTGKRQAPGAEIAERAVDIIIYLLLLLYALSNKENQ